MWLVVVTLESPTLETLRGAMSCPYLPPASFSPRGRLPFPVAQVQPVWAKAESPWGSHRPFLHGGWLLYKIRVLDQISRQDLMMTMDLSLHRSAV